MKLFIVFSMVIAASVAVPNNYYQQRVGPPAPPPVRVAYEAPKATYEAPKSYDSYGSMTKAADHIPIITHTFDTDHKGNYRLQVETGNGIKGNSQGVLKDIGAKEGPVVAKSGSYSYVGDDGKTYTTNWTADENGFHATGDHLPVAPPIPDAILKSLEVPRIPEFQPGNENMNKAAAGYGSYSAPAVRTPSYSSYSAPAPAAPLPMRSSY